MTVDHLLEKNGYKTRIDLWYNLKGMIMPVGFNENDTERQQK